MKTQILKQEKNPFLNREEIILEIESEASPSFEDVKREIGEDSELTVVKKISGGFGKKKFTAEVFVYNSKEDRYKIEPKGKKNEGVVPSEAKPVEKKEETQKKEIKGENKDGD